MTDLYLEEHYTARLIAAVVRNQMEDFHCKHLSDAQMKELNPIIRNAIYTAIVNMRKRPAYMFKYYKSFVPPYWEWCKLIKRI